MRLNWRSTLNLTIGIGITIAGLAVLFYFIYHSPNAGARDGGSSTSTQQYLTYLLPRLSAVILIEVFAYFFLRLYKAGLDDIKYFENELTNLETKHIALVASMQIDDLEAKRTVIGNIVATERNHVLKEKETTVELEKAKLETGAMMEVVKAFGGQARK